MKNISTTIYRRKCERMYFRSTPIYCRYLAWLPWFTSFSFPCSKLCKYQRYWIFELLYVQTLCLVWLGKRVTALKGAVSLASTQHEHKHNVQQQTVNWAVWQHPIHYCTACHWKALNRPKTGLHLPAITWFEQVFAGGILSKLHCSTEQ